MKFEITVQKLFNSIKNDFKYINFIHYFIYIIPKNVFRKEKEL